MKPSWSLREMTLEVWHHQVSCQMVLTCLNLSHQNLWLSLIKTLITGIRTMSKSRKWNFLSLTVLTKTALLEVSWMVTILMAVSSQQVQYLLNSRRAMRTRLPTHHKTQWLSIIFSTLIVKATSKLWNSLIRKRQIHAQLCRIKISVRLSTLPLTVMLMQHRQMVKMEQTVSCVTQLHQVTLSKLAIRTLVTLSMRKLSTTVKIGQIST